MEYLNWTDYLFNFLSAIALGLLNFFLSNFHSALKHLIMAQFVKTMEYLLQHVLQTINYFTKIQSKKISLKTTPAPPPPALVLKLWPPCQICLWIQQLVQCGDNLLNYPENTKHLYNICTTLAQRLRCWTNVVQMLCKCLVFASRGGSKGEWYNLPPLILNAPFEI